MKNRFPSSTGNSKSKRRFKSFTSRSELLEARMMLAGDVVQNVENPFDVNGDGETTPRDAAIIAMRLATSSGNAGALQRAAAEPPPTESASISTATAPFYDVTGDGALTAADFESVVNALNGSGEPGDVITVHVQTTDLSGNPITSVEVGDEYLLQVRVQDTQPVEPVDGFGVFSAFLDVQYDAGLTSVVGNLDFGSVYTNQQQGDTSVAGLIDEAGGFAGFTPAGDGEVELFTVRMQADSPGNLTFSTNAADGGTSVSFTVFGSLDLVSNDDILFGSTSLQINGGVVNDQPDLAAFARALDAAGVELWTTTLNARARIAQQLDLFGDGRHFLPINELQQKAPDANDRLTLLEFTPEAVAAGRTAANIWVFPDQTESGGELLTLEQISARSGVPIPMTSIPSVIPIDDVTVLAGSPLHIPLDGYDPNDDDLTWTVSVGDSNALETAIPEGNRSIRFDVNEAGRYLGDLVFELYETRAPLASGRIIELAEADFYDDVIFHRVVNEFVIQGGDPDGNGTGGSDLGDFDDQYHVDLQHNRTGILSMAKTSDDTNDSQFFVTEGETRGLDFNHTIFGQLVEGERVRETISNVGVQVDDLPTLSVRISEAEVFEDNQNAVLMLNALQTTGTTTVTVTATDSAGNSASQTFDVTLGEDTINAPPFLDPIGDQSFAVGETAQFQLGSTDVDGDPVVYNARLVGNDPGTIEVDEDGLVTVSGFVGTREADVAVSPVDGDDVFSVDAIDRQRISITIAADGPTGIDLLAITDSGVSDTDNITNVTDLQFEVFGVSSGASTVILADGVEIARTVAGGSTVVVTADTSDLSAGDHVFSAAIEIDGALSLASSPVTVTLDRDAPAAINNSAPETAAVGTDYIFDADHNDEGTVRYSLANAPAGMAIDDSTGAVTWLPVEAQAGTQAFEIVVSDIAGNTTANAFTVAVAQSGAATISLVTTDLGGDAISSIAEGSAFQLQIFVEDNRTNPSGIGRAFVDLMFDSSLASVDAAGIQIGAEFTENVSTGTLSSGLISGIGGATSSNLGGGQFLLATVPMVANDAGTLLLDLETNTGGVFFADGVLAIAAESLTITDASVDVLQVADELTANNDTFVVDEDTIDNELAVLANDLLGPNSQTLEITSVLGLTEGGAAVISDDMRTIIYTPAADFEGTEEFSYTIRDAAGFLASAEVTVTVNNVNDPPTANDDFYPRDLPPYDPQRDGDTDPRLLLVEDSTEAVFFFVIENDSVDPDVELATVSTATSLTGATVRVEEATLNTNISYIPGANVSGTDTFTYAFLDTGTPPLQDEATVTVEILRRNDPPTVLADAFDVGRGRSITIPASDILGNDSPGPLESEQTLEIIDVRGGTRGSAVLNADGSVTYTANAGAEGTDTIRYTVRDNGVDDIFPDTSDPDTVETVENFLENETGVITFTFVDANQEPIAFNDSISVAGGSSATVVNVLGNDADPDDDTLSVVSVTQGSAGGTVTLINGEVSYTPAASFVGPETFSYTMTDGEFERTAQVTVTVTDPATTTSSSFSGSVYFDLNNDGIMSSEEQGIGNVAINLTGTDIDGNAVSRTTVTDVSGSYRFDALPKGTFSITQQQPVFLLDGIDSASAVSGADGDDTFTITVGDSVITSEGNMFAERGLSPRFALLDMLSSNRGGNGFMTSVHAGSSQFIRGVEGWDAISDLRVTVSDDGSQVTIRGTNSSSERVRSTVDATDRRVRMIGREGDAVLLRISAASSDFSFQLDTDAVDAAFANA